MKIFFLFFILFFSIKGWGASISIQTDSKIYCGNDPNRPNEIYFVKPEDPSRTSTETTSNALTKVYVPIFNSGSYSTDTSNADFSIFTYLDATSKPVNSLPIIGDPSGDKSYVRHYFDISTPNPSYLYAGWINPQNNGQVYILSSSGVSPYYISSLSGNVSNLMVNFYFNNLCEDRYLAEFNPCLNLKFNSTTVNQKTNTVYFFTSQDPDLTPSTPITLKDNEDILAGIYFEYIMSNVVSPDPIPSITTVAKGDGRVNIKYTGKGIQQMKDVIAVKYEGPPGATPTNPNYAEVLMDGGSIASYDNGTNPSGSVILKGLQNNTEIWSRVAYIDFWGFATYFSNDASQIPESIQTFLQEKECYLLSAGFQKEHFILEYFRDFRDKFLLERAWGRTFVQWYYDTAPYYAKNIYNNDLLRFVIRSSAYLAYFIMRYHLYLLFVLFISFCFYFLKRTAIFGK